MNLEEQSGNIINNKIEVENVDEVSDKVKLENPQLVDSTRAKRDEGDKGAQKGIDMQMFLTLRDENVIWG